MISLNKIFIKYNNEILNDFKLISIYNFDYIKIR